ncbi:MAG: transposase [Holosporales bacterium]
MIFGSSSVSQGSAEAVKSLVGLRWKIEQLHRELKQLTGIEKCQCRRQRAKRNHIACAMIVLVCLKRLAVQCKTTAYRLKGELLGEYMRKQLKSPTIRFA